MEQKAINYNEVRGNKIKDMIIYLTSNCQLKCNHCYLHEEKKPKELSIKDMQWIKNTFDIKNVNFIGGEPFLYSHLEEALAMFDKITLTTNGVFLASESSKVDHWIDLFKQKSKQSKTEERFLVQLSIEGNEEITDAIRGKGVWKKVMTTAQLLKKNGIGCYFRSSYHEGNLDNIPWIIDNVCQSLGIPLLLFPQIGMPPLDIGQQIWLFKLILDKNVQYKSRHAVSQPHFMQWLGEPGRCGAGAERLCITYNREIIPCHFDFDYYLGQIGTPLAIINKNRELFLKTAKQIKSDCVFCKNSNICRSSCYVSSSNQGCPFKGNYNVERWAHNQHIDMNSISLQVSNMKGLLRGSLIC
jgi:radical SAM protein with 4Fe4S-binding SPASM domain